MAACKPHVIPDWLACRSPAPANPPLLPHTSLPSSWSFYFLGMWQGQAGAGWGTRAGLQVQSEGDRVGGDRGKRTRGPLLQVGVWERRIIPSFLHRVWECGGDCAAEEVPIQQAAPEIEAEYLYANLFPDRESSCWFLPCGKGHSYHPRSFLSKTTAITINVNTYDISKATYCQIQRLPNWARDSTA